MLSSEVSTESRVGTEFELIATFVLDGVPVPDTPVAFDVVSGPHSGLSVKGRTNAQGQAFFAYTGRSSGVDVVVANIEMGEGGGQSPVGPSVVLNEWLSVIGKAYLDVTPGFCPSPLFAGTQGTVNVALIGGPSFNVEDVDPSSLYLSDVAPIGFNFEDITRPGQSEDCPCSNEGGDGITDLVLTFEAHQLVAALGPTSGHEFRRLNLTGRLKGGISFDAVDCVLVVEIVPNGGQPAGDGVQGVGGMADDATDPKADGATDTTDDGSGSVDNASDAAADAGAGTGDAAGTDDSQADAGGEGSGDEGGEEAGESDDSGSNSHS